MSPEADRFDPTGRFSERVDHYIRYRPSYPAELMDCFRTELGLTPDHVVADIGSGTGILSELFLERGNTVYGVEPNRDMRRAAEASFADRDRFHSVDGRAEATGLPDHAVDFVVAGQAFHWFDPERTRAEFLRIAKPGSGCALVWNHRKTDATALLQGYEAFLLEWGTDYAEVSGQYERSEAFDILFGNVPYQSRAFSNAQTFDFDGLRGRLMSSSYVPTSDSPKFAAMLEGLEKLFAAHEENGKVRFEYDTRVYFGKLLA